MTRRRLIQRQPTQRPLPRRLMSLAHWRFGVLLAVLHQVTWGVA